MGRGDTRVSDSEGVRREKVNGRVKKQESLPWEREDTKKHNFSTAKDEDNIYRRCNAWERDCFPIFFFGKQLIEYKPYFY